MKKQYIQPTARIVALPDSLMTDQTLAKWSLGVPGSNKDDFTTEEIYDVDESGNPWDGKDWNTDIWGQGE